jgi:tRNA modification GTPase
MTIFALASGGRRAGVAVVRASGPKAGAVLEALTGRPLPPPREMTLAGLHHPQSGELIDRALVVWFKGPASFTGEDVAEFHLHGGPAVVAALVDALAALPGLRPAEAGEFSRRAFENGKLDLTCAEGLADLINAETEAQRRQAMRQMGGVLARLYDGWRERLVGALAYVEAGIDFSDEDLPAQALDQAAAAIAAIHREIAAHLADCHRGERLRDGFHIVILGAPNVGKSSLLNALARREAAIVSPQPGTTRDVIESHLDLGGYPVILADTAGLREATQDIEREGIARARARAAAADLILMVCDARDGPAAPSDVPPDGAGRLTVYNKADLVSAERRQALAASGRVVSAKSGVGLDDLVAELIRRAAAGLDSGGQPVITRARHRRSLQDCLEHLARYQAGRDQPAEEAAPAELAAEDLRLAVRALGRITGRVDVEDLLDVVFRDFCIGK